MATSSSSRRNAGASRGAAADTVAALALAVLIGCVGIDVPSAGPDVWVEPATGMRFVRVPAGSFTMGTPPGVPGREPEEIPHEGTLTRDFYLGQFEVAQAPGAAGGQGK